MNSFLYKTWGASSVLPAVLITSVASAGTESSGKSAPDCSIFIAGGIILLVSVAIVAFFISRLIRRLTQTQQQLQQELQERQAAETQLTQSKARYQKVMDHISLGVALISPDHRIIMANRALAEMFNTSPEKLAGQKCYHSFQNNRDAICEFCPSTWAMASGQATESIMDQKREDGTRFIARLHATPIFDHNKKMAGFLEIVEDITKRRKAEKKLLESEARYRSLFSELSEGFALHELICDEDGKPVDYKFLEINPAFEHMTGVKTHSIVGKTIREIHPNIEDCWIEIYGEVALSGKPARFEQYSSHLDKHFEVFAYSPSKGLFATLFQDISERKKAEKELELATQRELELGVNIQQALLQGTTPRNLNGTQVAALTIPSRRIDGDFHDFIQYNHQHFDVIIGDVMGKGGSAALLGAATKLEFMRTIGNLVYTTSMSALPTPEEIVMHVHQQTCDQLIQLNGFSSVCYARFDLDKLRMDYVDCGHTSTIHYRNSTRNCNLLRGRNMPLGFSKEETYKQQSVQLESGDIILFYSDGLSQAQNDKQELFGTERLSSLLEQNSELPPDVIARHLIDNVNQFASDQHPPDDLTCIVIKIDNVDEKEALVCEEFSIKSDLTELVLLRDFIRKIAAQVPGVDDPFINRLELAVNEVASSIILHAYRGMSDQDIYTKAIVFGKQMHVIFQHGGNALNKTQICTPALDGRPEEGVGMFIIRNCVDEIQYSTDKDNTNCIRLIKRTED